MMISWKTDGSAGAVDTVRNWLEEGSNFTSYISWADANGRIDYKWEIVGDDHTLSQKLLCQNGGLCHLGEIRVEKRNVNRFIKIRLEAFEKIDGKYKAVDKNCLDNIELHSENGKQIQLYSTTKHLRPKTWYK